MVRWSGTRWQHRPDQAGSAALRVKRSVSVCRVGESAAATVLDHDLEPARNAEARDRRGISHADDRVLDPLPVLGYQPGHDVIGVQLREPAVHRRIQDDEHRTEIGGVGLQQKRHSREADRVGHARRLRG